MLADSKDRLISYLIYHVLKISSVKYGYSNNWISITFNGLKLLDWYII